MNKQTGDVVSCNLERKAFLLNAAEEKYNGKSAMMFQPFGKIE